MSSDLQLLEFAAKAAGYIPATQDGGAPFVIFDGADPRDWNPLEDDGDALRLAVKLEIKVLPNMEATSARKPSYTKWFNEDARTDPYAATRRAIVRAAAEIGKSMS